MKRPRRDAERFAVLDTETTGFSKADRIVEIAVLTVVGGEIVDEFDTLLQPQRDPGPVHVHGITPGMLQAAPRFADVVHDIAVRLHGAVLVAHNIHFDLRQILADGVVTPEEVEFARTIATSLNLAFEGLAATPPPDGTVQLSVSMRVCFTGTATINGSAMRRDVLKGLAEAFGLTVVAGVTRKCDLLIAADPLSQSGKAAKARDYGIPIIATEEFLGLLTA